MQPEDQEAAASPLARDIIWGAEQIGEYCGVPARRIYHWADQYARDRCGPPIRSEGRLKWARRSELNSHFGATGN